MIPDDKVTVDTGKPGIKRAWVKTLFWDFKEK
jgi:hypothetical protein